MGCNPTLNRVGDDELPSAAGGCLCTANLQSERQDSSLSWLTFLAHAKDSLWSMDLFRTESILLRTHWMVVIMHQFTRPIIGFGVQATAVDGMALYRMFNQAIPGQGLPVRLSLDRDPLFEFQR